MLPYHKTPVIMFTLLIVLSLFNKVEGAFIFNVTQVTPSAVYVTGSGTINLSGLIFLANGGGSGAYVYPSAGQFAGGPFSLAAPTQDSNYSGVSGPRSFGPGGGHDASSGSGDSVAISPSEIGVPLGYVSGAPLMDTTTYSGQTFATLGLTPGTYLYTWGSGPTADSLTINIGVVPEPASVALIAVPVAIAMLRRRRRHLVSCT